MISYTFSIFCKDYYEEHWSTFFRCPASWRQASFFFACRTTPRGKVHDTSDDKLQDFDARPRQTVTQSSEAGRRGDRASRVRASPPSSPPPLLTPHAWRLSPFALRRSISIGRSGRASSGADDGRTIGEGTRKSITLMSPVSPCNFSSLVVSSYTTYTIVVPRNLFPTIDRSDRKLRPLKFEKSYFASYSCTFFPSFFCASAKTATRCSISKCHDRKT